MAIQLQAQGRWNEIKGFVKERWGSITDQELLQAEGNLDRLVGLIQRKSGEARSAIERSLEELLEGNGSQVAAAVQQVSETARQYAQAAGEKASEAYDQVSETVREGYQRAEEYVQSKPTQSMAMAFGCGLLTGLIVGVLFRSR